MKKLTLFFLGLLLTAQFALAGGLLHNTNQSAAWARMLARDASTEIDAVFFNPAGLTKMGDGFHISISNQSIFQTQTITSSFPFLNNGTYEGTIKAPLFPSVYLAYKTGRWVFSFGFMPIGGGGGASFDRGVPMMEVPIASLVPAFSSMGVTGYSVDMNFEGTSVYWGLQGGISFAINDHISVFAGARYVIAKNTYTGYIRDIKLQTAGGDVPAADFMNGVANQATDGAAQATAGAGLATGAGNSMQPIIDGGGGVLTFDQAVALGVLTPEQSTGLQGGLIQFGYTQEQIDAMNMEQAQGSYYGTATYLTDMAADLLVQAGQLQAGASLMGDQDADITQTGSGITPIIGVNLSFADDNVNIGIKYEFKTKMDLTNDVPDGKGFKTGINPETGAPIYMFPDGKVTNADLPAMLSVGIDLRIVEPLKFSLGYHTYFDSNTGWAEEADPNQIDNNFWELAVGVEWNLTKKFLLSAGYLRAETGANQNYQSNLGFSLTTNTFAFGGAYAFNDTFKLNLGGYYVMYEEMSYQENYAGIPYKETYLKNTFAIALGLDIAIHSKK